jgi:hypothetical protein
MVGLKIPYIHYGILPATETFGYEVAVQTVLASRQMGKEYSEDHTQWDSCRKFRTAYSNHVKTSPQANTNPLKLGDDKGKTQNFVQDGCASYWYSRLLFYWL